MHITGGKNLDLKIQEHIGRRERASRKRSKGGRGLQKLGRLKLSARKRKNPFTQVEQWFNGQHFSIKVLNPISGLTDPRDLSYFFYPSENEIYSQELCLFPHNLFNRMMPAYLGFVVFFPFTDQNGVKHFHSITHFELYIIVN